MLKLLLTKLVQMRRIFVLFFIQVILSAARLRKGFKRVSFQLLAPKYLKNKSFI